MRYRRYPINALSRLTDSCPSSYHLLRYLHQPSRFTVVTQLRQTRRHIPFIYLSTADGAGDTRSFHLAQTLLERFVRPIISHGPFNVRSHPCDTLLYTGILHIAPRANKTFTLSHQFHSTSFRIQCPPLNSSLTSARSTQSGTAPSRSLILSSQAKQTTGIGTRRSWTMLLSTV